MSATYIPASLRRLVQQRAKECCEYCLYPESDSLTTHEIDHIIAEKHGGLTQSENLALSCKLCNSHKGSDVASVHPETREIIRLFHPRLDRWTEHFQLQDGGIVAKTSVGLVTARLLQFNLARRVEERKLLIELQILQIPD
jgi:hypothetical protein